MSPAQDYRRLTRPCRPRCPRGRSDFLKQAGLPDIRFHDLRHTCATLLLSRGHHPKLVQELLGHASVAMTLDRYSHVLPGMGIRLPLLWSRVVLEHVSKPRVQQALEEKEDANQLRCPFTCGSGEPPIGV
jgi:hypothetical protein